MIQGPAEGVISPAGPVGLAPKKADARMPQPTKAIISNEQKSGIRKGSNRASTGKVGALLLSIYI